MKKRTLLLIVVSMLLTPLIADAAYFRINIGTRFLALIGQYFVVRKGDSGAAACSPTDVAGLKAWYKADALGLSDGDPVNTWTDSSGNGNDAPKAGTAPVFKTGIIGGKPVVRFNSTGYFGKGFTLDQPDTVFVVTYSPSNCEGCTQIDGATTLTNTFYQSPNTDPPPGFNPYSGGFGTHVSVTWSVPNVISFAWNGASSLASVNGTITYVTMPGSMPSPNGMTIGAWANGSGNMTGDVAEVYVYDSVLSTSTRQAQEDCLGAKYGITITH